MSGTTPNTQISNFSVNRNYKVLIADDHDIFRHGLKTLLEKYPFIDFKGEASNGLELKKMVKKIKPDIVFTDLHMPGGHGVEAVEEIRGEFPSIKIVVLSFYDDSLTIEKMMKMGIAAYLTKNISFSLLDAMFENLVNDQPYISPHTSTKLTIHTSTNFSSPTLPAQSKWLANGITHREKQVLKMTAQGLSQKEIAVKLQLGNRTIETHKKKLMQKLGAKNKAELISIAYEYKLL